VRALALATALVVLSAAHGPAQTFSPPHETARSIQIEGRTLDHLEQLAETSHVEDGRCLLGAIVNDTARVYAAADAPWTISDQVVNRRTGVARFRQDWDLCPPGTLGIWHSHPLRLARKLHGEQREKWCPMSPPDRAVWLSSQLPLLVVSTQRGHTCYYVRMPNDSLGVSLPSL